MLNPVLHIGYGKTASTWFQESFYPYVSDIEFCDLHKARSIVGCTWGKLENTTGIYEQFKKPGKRLVLCDESMVGNVANLKKNPRTYRSIFGTAEIIIFIRNQMDKIPSNYSEYIKAGGTLKFYDYMAHTRGLNMAQKHQYHEVIDLYKNVFGNEHVHVYLYEDFCANTTEFLKQFSHNHGFNVAIESLNTAKLNTSLPKKFLNQKRIVNSWVKNSGLLYRATGGIKRLMGLPPKVQFSLWLYKNCPIFKYQKHRISLEEFFDPESIEKIRGMYVESNRKLIEEHGLTAIKQYGYPLK